MTDLNNPAVRLRAWLQLLSQQHMQDNGINIVCGLWGLDQKVASDRAVVMRRVAEIMDLGPEIRRRAEGIPRWGAMVLRNYEQVEETLFNHLLLRSHQLGQVMEPMQPTAWTALDQLVDLLDDPEHAFTIDEEQTEDLLRQVQDLIAQVNVDADLTAEQRSVILQHLLEVERALLDIDLVGPEPVERAVDGLMGALMRFSTKAVELSQNPSVVALMLFLSGIAQTFGVAADWHEIATSHGGTVPQLPSGGGGSN